MSNKVLIKRSSNSGVTPTSLEYGELAINTADSTLFYKDNNNSIKSFSLIQQNVVTSVAGRFGDVVLTKNDVGLLNVDNTADSTKNVLSATKLTTPRTISVSGDVVGSISFDGSSDVTISTVIQPNSVALGADTTGNYVSGVTAGSGITITGTAGEGWSPTISHSDTSSASNIAIDNSNGNVIQDIAIAVDTYGHVTTLTASSYDLDNRYYTETEVQSSLPQIGFNTSSGVTVSQGQIAWNADERTLDIGLGSGVTLQAGQEQLIGVQNNTGATITNGTVCMYASSIGNSGKMRVKPFDGTNTDTLVGIATEDILDGYEGFVTTFGKIRGINTLSWGAGDILYTTSSGTLTNVEPVSGIKLPVAVVISSSATGTIFVRVTDFNRNQYEPANTNIQSHISNVSNPHGVTKAQVGLGSVDNTADSTKNVLSATKLTTPRTINGVSFDGSSNITITDSTKQPLDNDLTAIAALSGTSGFLKKTATDTWTLDTSTYVTSSGVTSVTGTAPIVSSGGTTPAISISAATTSSAGSMSAADKTKLDAISGTNTGDETETTIKSKLGISTLSGSNTGDQTITLTGDVTGSGTGSFATTLSNSGVTAGTYTKVTVDAKGRVTTGSTLLASDVPTLNQSTTGNAATATLATTATTANALNTSNAYTGTSFNSITALSSTTPSMNGTAAIGTSTTVARADHAHASDTSKASLSGATFTGAVSGTTFSATTFTGALSGNATTATTATNLSGGSISATSGTFSGDLSVTGNLTINGTSTTINSTSLTLDDPILTLGGDTAPTVDDNKDRGIEFIWRNGTTAKVGFFGYDDSVGSFTFIPDATNTSEVFSGAAGNAVFSAITGTTGTFSSTVTGTSFNSITALSSTTPVMDGTAAIGTSTTVARADHVHASDTSKASLSGATFTGAVSGTTFSGTSFNSITALSSTTPLVAGTATIGTSTTVARADHVHPVQTSVSGNAGTATKLTTARTINGISFDGSANISINAVDSTARIASSEKGVANGVATLDASGLVPSTQLPSYVDDVLEFASLSVFPTTGVIGKIYVDLATNKTYRWSGTAYIYITSGAVDSVAGKTGVVSLVKADVDLGNVDNTSDLNKPISTATQTALNLKANKATTLSGYGITDAYTKTEIDNSLNLKADKSTTYTKTEVDSKVGVSIQAYNANTVIDPNYVHTDNNFTTVEKTKLSGIESGAQVNTVTSVANKTGAISLTKSDVGLSNVDNTSDLNKPISTATQNALNLKVDKVSGKGLSTEDYTTAEKTKLSGLSNYVKPVSEPISYITELQTALDSKVSKTGVEALHSTDALRISGTTLSLYKGDGTFESVVTKDTIYTHPDSGVTAGTYSKVTVNTQGHITSGASLLASDIPSLDASKITTGTIDSARLPSFVDDVLEFVNLAGFPATGEAGKIYIALDTNKTYRWSGSTYVYITSGAVDSVAGKTGVVSLNKADVGLVNVDNTSDANKPVSTATQTALNLKANLDSPALTGTPLAPTASTSTNTTQIATTAFVQAQKVNTALTGTPTTPTAIVGTNTTQIASTAYVKAEISNETYSKTQLNAGQLDNRYYTETELNSGALDTRYYTEAEIDTKLAAQNDASEIKVTPSGNLVSTNVQAALVELQGDIDNRYIKAETDILLAGKVDDSEIASVNLLRVDRYLAAQNIANMTYVSGDLAKIQYNTATDVDYETLGYTSGNLTSINHYVGSVLKGTTTLSYTAGNLTSAVFVGV